MIRDVGIVGPLWRKKEILELPLTNKVIENPTNLINKVIEEISNGDKTINLPTIDNRTGNDTGKQAKNNMIMVRRRKMRKHKLRKLRKKMKFLWAKVRFSLRRLTLDKLTDYFNTRFDNVASGAKKKPLQMNSSLKCEPLKVSPPSSTSPKRSASQPNHRCLAPGKAEDCQHSSSKKSLSKKSKRSLRGSLSSGRNATNNLTHRKLNEAVIGKIYK